MEYNIEDEELKNGDVGELYNDPILEAHQIERKRKYLESMKPTSVNLQIVMNTQAQTEKSFKEFKLYIGYKNMVVDYVYIPLKICNLQQIVDYHRYCDEEFERMRVYNDAYYNMLLSILNNTGYDKDDITAYGLMFQRAVAAFDTYASKAVHDFEAIATNNIIDTEVITEVQKTSKQIRRYVNVFVNKYHTLAGYIYNCFMEIEAAEARAEKAEKAEPQVEEPKISSDDVYASLVFGRKKIDFNRL
jgi:hypothetical protein